MTRRFVICIHKHYSGGQIEKNEVGGGWSAYGRQEWYIHGFGGKPKGRKPLGRWEDEIQTSRQKVGWGGMDWIDLAQDWGQVANGCECSYESSGSIKCWQFLC